jgi:hypothetical protein
VTSFGLTVGSSADVATSELDLGLGLVEGISTISGSVPDYDIQKLRITSPDLYEVNFFSGISANGYFRLSYDGSTSAPISSGASANDIRDIVEAFPGVNTVKVSRDYSSEKLGYKVNVSPGLTVLTCATGHTCNFSLLPSGELIYVGGSWFKVGQDRSDSTELPLALHTDASITVSYEGIANSEATIWRWGRGYEWSITFVDTDNASVLPIASGMHGLVPSTSLIAVRLDDCTNCLLVSGLPAWTNSYFSLLINNEYGHSTTTTVGVPQEVPAAVTSPTVTSVSGSMLKVSYFPPAGEGAEFITTTLFSGMTMKILRMPKAPVLLAPPADMVLALRLL